MHITLGSLLLIALQLNISLVQSRALVPPGSPSDTQLKLNTTNLSVETTLSPVTTTVISHTTITYDGPMVIANKHKWTPAKQEREITLREAQRIRDTSGHERQSTKVSANGIRRIKSEIPQLNETENASKSLSQHKYSSMDASSISYRIPDSALRNDMSGWRRSIYEDNSPPSGNTQEKYFMSGAAGFTCSTQIVHLILSLGFYTLITNTLL